LDFLTDGDAVGVLAQAQDGQQNDLFELAECVRRHFNYILD
jgi:hypothetical protein